MSRSGRFKSDDLLRLFLTLRTNRDAIVAAVAEMSRKYDWVLQQQYSEIMQFLAGRSADPLPLHTQAFSETKVLEPRENALGFSCAWKPVV